MARTHLTTLQIRAPYRKQHTDAIKTKLDDFDDTLDGIQNTNDYKTSVRFATTANINLATTALTAIDGVTPVAGDRALVKNQSAPEQNGIYVAAATAWARATDADASADVTSGMQVFVSEGTANGDKWYLLTTDDPIVLGTDGLTFTEQPNAADLASTASGKGASLVGLQDASGLVAGANVEAAVSTDIAKGNGLLAMAPVRRVRAVTSTNLAAFTGISETFDGLTLVEGDRVLVAAQSTPAENGIYVVGAVAGGVADWARAADMAAAAVVPNGTIVVVDAGTLGANSIYKLTNAGTITIATTGLTFHTILTSTSSSPAMLKKTVTVDEEALSGASQAVNIGTALPANAIVVAHEILVNEQGALAGNDLTITIGGTDVDAIVASTDLDALGAGNYQGTLGAHPQGSFSSEQLVATFAATDLATLSAGNWTITVWYFVLA